METMLDGSWKMRSAVWVCSRKERELAAPRETTMLDRACEMQGGGDVRRLGTVTNSRLSYEVLPGTKTHHE
jgi:hypothetical protein